MRLDSSGSVPLLASESARAGSEESAVAVEMFTKFQAVFRDMATEVKICEDVKSRLEELQAEIRLRTRKNVIQQELLTRLIDDAYESRNEVVDSFRESTVPLSKEEKEAMRRGRVSSGVETDEEDIDDILYG